MNATGAPFAQIAASLDANEQVTVAVASVVKVFVQVAETVPESGGAGNVLNTKGDGAVETVKVDVAGADKFVTKQVAVCVTPVLAPVRDRAVT